MKSIIPGISASLLLALTSSGVAEEKAGGFQREVWNEIWGGGLWHLKNSPKFIQEPDVAEFMEGAIAPSNDGDSYGQRLRGYLTPEVSGEYVFWIASDDNAELSLSTDDSKFNRRPIASINGLGLGYGGDFVAPLNFDRFQNQKSQLIQLEAGVRYFIEVLHKDSSGDDHLALAWTAPGKKREIIPGEVLTSYDGEEADRDQDELPDTWESAHNLSTTDDGKVEKNNGPLGDPDGDGWSNREECRNGTDPRRKEAEEGALMQEIWYGIPGNSMADLHASWRFFFPGDRRSLSRGFEANQERGIDQFGLRLRGFLTPTVSGSYRFAINGESSCELWISDSESKFRVKRVAWIEDLGDEEEPPEGTGWEKFDSQQSGEVQLEAGKSYYVEVLQKEGVNEGQVEVRWIPPGSETREVIPPSVVRSYVPTDEDPDDDGLPTEWELRYGLDAGDNGYDNGPVGDPDRDWIPNWVEYREGTDPTVQDIEKGAFTEEVWWQIKGNRLIDLTSHQKWFEGAHWTELRTGVFGVAHRGETYGMRLRARLTAPASGAYQFWIAGDNHCSLWISENEQKFQKRKIAFIEGPGTGTVGDYVAPGAWDVIPSQRSGLIRMEEGKEYFIEVLLKEGSGADHVEVAWTIPGLERQSLESIHLSSFLVDENDADDDYLPDAWEQRYGLSLVDNGLNDRRREGENGDFDNDLLTNREEFLAGTDPTKADTDGDGISDYDELKVYLTSPIVQDASPPELVHQFDFEPTLDPTKWLVDEEGAATALTRRGEMKFTFNLEEDGIYLIDFQAHTVGFVEFVPDIPVACLVDGIRVGDTKVAVGGTRSRWLTQWLAAGSHTVVIQNNNVHKDALLKINSLNLYRQEGADEDGNGIPDWLEKFYQANNSVFVSTTESYASPACVEGSARFPELCLINGGGIAARNGIGSQWFANVPLDANGPTDFEVSFDQGSQQESHSLTWLETDLFTIGGRSLQVRLGDSLKFGASSAGEAGMTIALNGAEIGRATPGSPLVFQFVEAGIHLLEASDGEGNSSEVQIKVYDVDFGEIFSVAGGFARIWELPELPQELNLEVDPRLLSEELVFEDNGPRAFQLRAASDEFFQATVLTRVSPGGPIAAATKINVIDLIHLGESRDQRIVKVLPDGTKVIETNFGVLGEVPDDLVIALEFLVTDCLFENGDNKLELAAEDFDETGEAPVRIYKGSGHGGGLWTCHSVHPYPHDRLQPLNQ